MAKQKWFNDNLSSMLLGKNKQHSVAPEESQSSEELPPQPTPSVIVQSPPKSSDIVQPIMVPTTDDKRVSFPVYLPHSLNQRFQQAIAHDGQKKSALIRTWIKEYLRQREQYEN